MEGKVETLVEQAKADGPVTNIVITHYHKYQFTISFCTDNHLWSLVCGGVPDDVYRFDPFGGWAEWEAAGIAFLSQRTLPNVQAPRIPDTRVVAAAFDSWNGYYKQLKATVKQAKKLRTVQTVETTLPADVTLKQFTASIHDKDNWVYEGCKHKIRSPKEVQCIHGQFCMFGRCVFDMGRYTGCYRLRGTFTGKLCNLCWLSFDPEAFAAMYGEILYRSG